MFYVIAQTIFITLVSSSFIGATIMLAAHISGY